MSDKSGTSAGVISLPQGGGALQGIGETFSPDLFTGTGNFTVPVALPPGRNGFQPQLNLVYSTGNGNGPFGLGWSLSVPGVSRKTAKGVPRYRDGADDLKDRDTFVLSGAEDLESTKVSQSLRSPAPSRHDRSSHGVPSPGSGRPGDQPVPSACRISSIRCSGRTGWAFARERIRQRSSPQHG